MKNKLLIILPISLLVVLSGCTGPKEITTPAGKVNVQEGSGNSWCSTGTKITTSTPQGQSASFEIKGLATYNGTQVCQADYNYDQGSMTYYFNEKKDYMVMLFKDKSGKVVQEMNLSNYNTNIVNTNQ